jgi:hypothetical protein
MIECVFRKIWVEVETIFKPPASDTKWHKGTAALKYVK